MRRRFFPVLLLLPLLLFGCGSQSITPTTTTTTTTRPNIYWNGKTVTGTEIFSAEVIYCTGNISIENGGSLILNDIKLYMSCESDARYGIFVNSGGTLKITNESFVTAYNTAEGYYAFWYKDGSAGSIYNSTIEATWTPSTEGSSPSNEAGLFVQAHTFLVSGSTLRNSKGNGLLASGCQNLQVTGSRLNNNRLAGLAMINTVEAYLYNNSVEANSIGLKIISTALAVTVESNRIKDNTTYGVQIDNASPVFYRNTITGNDYGFYIQKTHGTPYPVIGDSSITRSGYNNLAGNNYGIHNHISNDIMAENNYWDRYSVGAIGGYNYNEFTSAIDVAPWLSAAP